MEVDAGPLAATSLSVIVIGLNGMRSNGANAKHRRKRGVSY